MTTLHLHDMKDQGITKLNRSHPISLPTSAEQYIKFSSSQYEHAQWAPHKGLAKRLTNCLLDILLPIPCIHTLCANIDGSLHMLDQVLEFPYNY